MILFILISFFKNNPYIFEKFQSRIEIADIYIKNSIFHKISYYNKGGVINFISNLLNIKIELSIFYSCFSINDEGGAIYIDSVSGNILIKLVCGFNCTSGPSKSYLFGFFKTSSDSILNISYFSMSNCKEINPSRLSVIATYDGVQTLENMNSSYNYLKFVSGFYYLYSKLGQTIFSNFIENFASEFYCIYHQFYCNMTLNNCNIIKNQQNNNGGIVYSRDNSVVNYISCVFLENYQACTFEQYSSAILRIVNCWSDSYTIMSGRNVEIINFLGIGETLYLSYLPYNFCYPLLSVSSYFSKNLNYLILFNIFFN